MMTRRQLFTVFFFAVLLFLLAQLYNVFAGFLAPIAWAIILALLFQPLYLLTLRLTGDRRGLAAAILTFLIVLVVAIPATLLSGLLAREGAAFLARTSHLLETGGLTSFIDAIRASIIGQLFERALPHFEDLEIDLNRVAAGLVNSAGSLLVANLGGMAKNLAVLTLDLFVVLFTVFFLLRDGDRMYASLLALIPMEQSHKEAVLARLQDMLSAVVRGMALTAVVQAVVTGIGLVLVGLPFAAFLGVLAGFLSLLPFGPPIVWMACAIYLFVQGSLAKAIFLTIYGLVVIGTIDSFIRPILIGGRARIPTVMLFFGIIGGLEAYGFLGIFLGPVLIATLAAFVQIYRDEYFLKEG
jgi:predicted PurR-regulated permease PerM